MPGRYVRKYPARRASSSRAVVYRGKGAYRRSAPARRYSRRVRYVRPVKAPQQSSGSWLSDVGSKAGSALGSIVGKFLGLGEYKMARNSLINGSSPNQVPFMHSAKDGVRIRHREFIADITTQAAFTNTSYSVNPGLSLSFPWLSALAQNFEEYRFEGLVFEYVPMCGDAVSSTNSTMGVVVMAAEYNPTQAAYVNKQQMENSMWAMSDKPSKPIALPIECAPSLNPLSNQYIRIGAVASGQDVRFYDLCNIQVATVGAQASFKAGELWATYDIVLMKPQLDSGLALSAEIAHYTLVAPSESGSAWFGTSRSAYYDNIGLTVAGASITFPLGSQGTYHISYSQNGASTVLTNINTPTYTNCAQVTSYLNNNTLSAIRNGGTTSSIYFNSSYVYIADPTLQAVVTFSGGTLCTTPTYGDLIVTQVNDNFRLNP
ncbi:capsid protein [Crucivirus-353]|nr:capsid protein [Crucivirus-349]QMW68820.1 capsid protein [Crucivirus-353]